MKVEKTPYSSIVGGGLSIIMDDGERYEVVIMGSTNGITKQVDAEICKTIMTALNRDNPAASEEALKALDSMSQNTLAHAKRHGGKELLRRTEEEIEKIRKALKGMT